MSNVTFVTGLYNIGKEHWPTFTSSMHTYCVWLENTINRVHGNFVIFVNESMEQRVREYASRRRASGETHVVVLPFESLPAYQAFYEPLKSLLESDAFQKRRPFQGIPEHSYPEYNIIMFNKVHFMKAALGVIPSSSHFVWLDAGLVREPVTQTLDWPSRQCLKADKIALFALNDSYSIYDRYEHVLSQTRFTQGGCLIVPSRLLDRIIPMTTDVIRECLSNGVIGSDEKVIDLCYLKDPNMFEVNVCDWRQYFKFYNAPTSEQRSAKQNLVLGVFGRYSLDNIRNWCDSVSKLRDVADLVLIQVDNRDRQEIAEFCAARGVRVVHKPREGKIHHARYHVAWEFLCEESRSWDLVLWSDVNDVVFQKDPFPVIRDMLDTHKKDILVCSEGLHVFQEPWNQDNIHKCFPHLIQKVINKEVLCSGVMAGRFDYLKSLLFLIYNFSNNITAHDIIDQAALITLLQTDNPLIRDHTYITTSSEDFVVHCAVSGPTEFFTSWGYCNSLKYDLPELENDTIVNKRTRVPYALVHQYNRIPEWKEALTRQCIGRSVSTKRLVPENTAVCVCTTSQCFSAWRENMAKLVEHVPNAHLLLDVTACEGRSFSQDLFSNVTEFTHSQVRETLPCPPPELPVKGHWWNPYGNRNIIWFYAYLRMVHFYVQHPDYDYYWFFDDDFQCNDWKEFLSGFRENRDGFLSYFLFKHRNVPSNVQPDVPNNDDKMFSKDWFGGNRFPGPGDTLPPGVGETLFGSFFAATRWSRASLQHMLEIIAKGYHGYHEGFVPTILHHAGFKMSTILRPDNKSSFFDNEKANIRHKNETITWSWL